MTERVIVLGGGNSPEREVSLRSAKSMQAALIEAEYPTVMIDPASGIQQLDVFDRRRSMVFPILHGSGGEDGKLQAILEEKGFKYLGSDVHASAAAFDKSITREKLAAAGLPIARGETVDSGSYTRSDLHKKPHVLKAATGGSSIGTYICNDTAQISDSAIQKVFSVCDTAVIEELVLGTEVTVGIFDNEALPIIEIIPPENGIFDYQNKYNGRTQEICPPKSLSVKMQNKLQEIAVTVHQVIGCRHLSRVDMIVGKAGPVVLEINTMPGMTNQSLYPKAAKQAGMSFPELAAAFVHMVEKID